MKTTVIATLALALSAAAAPLAGSGSSRHTLPRSMRSHRNLARRGQKCENKNGSNNDAFGLNFAAEAPADAPVELDTGAKENKKHKEHTSSSSWSSAAAQPTENGDNDGDNEDKDHGNNGQDHGDNGQNQSNNNQGGGSHSGWSVGKYAWGSGPDFLKIHDGKFVGAGPRENPVGTFYSLENPAENHGYKQTACGIDNPPDTTPLVAISTKNWDELWSGSSWDAPFCGHHVRVSYGGRSAVATVVDSCATCEYNHIDMSPILFYYLTDGKEAGDKLGMMTGDKGFTWEWVDDAAHTPGTQNFVELPGDGFHWDGAGGAGTNPW